MFRWEQGDLTIRETDMTELKAYQRKALQLSEQDDVAVALVDLKAGEMIVLGCGSFVLSTDVLAKHKFALKPFAIGQPITLWHCRWRGSPRNSSRRCNHKREHPSSGFSIGPTSEAI